MSCSPRTEEGLKDVKVAVYDSSVAGRDISAFDTVPIDTDDQPVVGDDDVRVVVTQNASSGGYALQVKAAAVCMAIALIAVVVSVATSGGSSGESATAHTTPGIKGSLTFSGLSPSQFTGLDKTAFRRTLASKLGPVCGRDGHQQCYEGDVHLKVSPATRRAGVKISYTVDTGTKASAYHGAQVLGLIYQHHIGSFLTALNKTASALGSQNLGSVGGVTVMPAALL